MVSKNGGVDMAEFRLRHGAKYPFDAPDSWWEAEHTPEPPLATDWAHRAARGVLCDLMDRRGIKRGFEELDEDVRVEIAESLAAIIRLANPHPTGE